ncbi:beta-ketoacyl synthase N-terminal-like domain-containing protein [Nonomuraea sp. NPDC005650]|uniref:type I polyketide synthase n=1 Tax=Nonomuraea sp. NPDC005650 TaxID=3157045 RepID=UPI0033B68F16
MSPEERLTSRLAALIAERTGADAAHVDPDVLFIDFGIASVDAVALAAELGAEVGMELPNTIFYDHPTPRALARHLAVAPPPERERQVAPVVCEPIAIVGIGCRLPGAYGPGQLWRLLDDGGDAVGALPERRRADHEEWDEPGVGVGGFLPDVEPFDPEFFAVNGREAAAMDPQQRLLLEVMHESVQDAGLRASDLAGSPTGVYVGISSSDFLVREFGAGLRPHGYAPTGVAHSVAANRLSYVLDLRGPSLAVDTACSSSLVAVHQAVTALRAGDCDAALVGGVNVILSPTVGRCFRAAGVLSPDGRCKSFGAAADGMGRSEGAVAVVLQRLSDALDAGNRVYALIRGGAVNSDGRTNGLMSPSALAQTRLLRSACAAAGVRPEEIDYVEGHGSGTPLGDQMELRALSEVLGRTGRRRELRIGSIKSNLGHLEAAAGLAGLVKVALALHHGRLPASLHADRLAQGFEWTGSGLAVQRRSEPWDGRLAGVSSFGFGGTNAHLVLESASGLAERPARDRRGRRYLPLSAHTPEALRELAVRWQSALAEPGLDVAAACATASGRRDHHAYRVAVSGDDAAGLAAELDRALSDLAAVPPHHARPGGLAFVLPDESWDEVVLDLAGELRRAGVRPDLVIGYGAGEPAAACVSGALTRADAAFVAGNRERLLAGLPQPQAMRLRLAGRVAERLCRRIDPSLAVAAVDGSENTTVVGPPGPLAELAAMLDGQVLTSALGPASPDHSALAEPVASGLAADLSGLPVNAGETPLVSALTGGQVDGRSLDAGHWARHIVSPTRLADALGHALGCGVTTFVELGAGATGPWLRALAAGRPATLVRCAGPDDLPGTLVRLYELGHDPDWETLNPPAAVVSIPLLPWSRTWTPYAMEALL